MKFSDSVRISATFPRIFLESMDKWAKATKTTRSGFIRDAVKFYTSYIVKHGKPDLQEA